MCSTKFRGIRAGPRRLSVRSIVYGEPVGRCIQYHLADSSAITGMSLRTEVTNQWLDYHPKGSDAT
nr:hypothetical protein [uncultured Oscillibacter sp.]